MEHGTKVAFITTSIVVGAVTYAVVFNMNNLVRQVSLLYKPIRSRILKHMEGDTDDSGIQNDEKKNESQDRDWWPTNAERFHVFGPEKQQTKPSEWLIIM